MNNLQHPDNFYLAAAEGWLGLGLPEEALLELNRISLSYQTDLAVMQVRYLIYVKTKCWNRALKTAKSMAALMPDASWGLFHCAYCLRELKHIKAAYRILISLADKHPRELRVIYTLACYSCQLGKLVEAKQWLKKAYDAAGKKKISSLRKIAKDDPDLEPLWQHS